MDRATAHRCVTLKLLIELATDPARTWRESAGSHAAAYLDCRAGNEARGVADQKVHDRGLPSASPSGPAHWPVPAASRVPAPARPLRFRSDRGRSTFVRTPCLLSRRPRSRSRRRTTRLSPDRAYSSAVKRPGLSALAPGRRSSNVPSQPARASAHAAGRGAGPQSKPWRSRSTRTRSYP